MTSGIPAERLSDDTLRHELLQLKRKRDDIAADGTAAQRANHEARTAELEAEFVRRFGRRDEAAAPDTGTSQDGTAGRDSTADHHGKTD
ncbi:MAG TPA: DUF6158 family protein [Jatrophihabitans sp.]|nr:DUF6158 family protein [Jatrophihabitans sp.]